ncbi:MAG TPA: VOC family protein [Acidimicrobiia bacterium]|nr:VOC family protein [Acidimicrobiia bacterium]
MATQLDAIGIVVSDMGETVDFYRRLGFAFAEGAESEGHVECPTPGGLRIMFDTEDMVRSFSEWEAPIGGHRVALAFLCEHPSEVDEKHLELTQNGGRSHVAPFDAPWGQRYATVLDPSGNPIDLFAWIR